MSRNNHWKHVERVLTHGSNESECINLPERHARELAPLARSNPAQAQTVWRDVVKASEESGVPVTAKHVREAVLQTTRKMDVHYSSNTPEWYTNALVVVRLADLLTWNNKEPSS